jgi:hypothetical protein
MTQLREAQTRLDAARADLDKLAGFAAGSAELADEYHAAHYRFAAIEREIAKIKAGLGSTATPTV